MLVRAEDGLDAKVRVARHGKQRDSRAALGAPIAAVEKDWLSRLRWYYAWIPIITSSATLWFDMSVIFVAGYVRRRAQNRRRLKEMEEEELVLAAQAHDYVAADGNTVLPSVRRDPAAPVRVTRREGEGDGEAVTLVDPGDKWVH